MYLLKVGSLAIGYTTILQKNIDFSLCHGDLLCVSGQNGKGKTTLFKTLLGQIEPLAGDVSYNVSLKQISHLPQFISHDIPLSITLGEILESFDASSSVKELFSTALLSRRWIDASGGEKQKVLIGSQLNHECKILFLDEPFNHIDKESIDSLLTYFRKIIDEKLINAIVYISHVSSPLMEQLKIKTLELR
jgi:ABC-type Mn2+/Zn2+ transport system ATPase subunit